MEIYSGAVLICKLLHCDVEVSCDLMYCNGSPSSDAFEGDETLATGDNNNYSHYLNSGGLSDKITRKYLSGGKEQLSSNTMLIAHCNNLANVDSL